MRPIGTNIPPGWCSEWFRQPGFHNGWHQCDLEFLGQHQRRVDFNRGGDVGQWRHYQWLRLDSRWLVREFGHGQLRLSGTLLVGALGANNNEVVTNYGTINLGVASSEEFDGCTLANFGTFNTPGTSSSHGCIFVDFTSEPAASLMLPAASAPTPADST